MVLFSATEEVGASNHIVTNNFSFYDFVKVELRLLLLWEYGAKYYVHVEEWNIKKIYFIFINIKKNINHSEILVEQESKGSTIYFLWSLDLLPWKLLVISNDMKGSCYCLRSSLTQIKFKWLAYVPHTSHIH